MKYTIIRVKPTKVVYLSFLRFAVKLYRLWKATRLVRPQVLMHHLYECAQAFIRDAQKQLQDHKALQAQCQERVDRYRLMVNYLWSTMNRAKVKEYNKPIEDAMKKALGNSLQACKQLVELEEVPVGEFTTVMAWVIWLKWRNQCRQARDKALEKYFALEKELRQVKEPQDMDLVFVSRELYIRHQGMLVKATDVDPRFYRKKLRADLWEKHKASKMERNRNWKQSLAFIGERQHQRLKEQSKIHPNWGWSK